MKQLSEIIASLEAARAILEAQEASSRQADIDLKRMELLYQKQVIPKEQFDRAKTNYDVAVAQVKAARDRIKQLEASLETQRRSSNRQNQVCPHSKPRSRRKRPL